MNLTHYYLKLLFVITSLLVFISANGQQNTITGTVTDAESEEALPGVSVVVKGTTRGTTTDIDGNYSINVTSGESLVYSFVGYQSEEIVVGNESVLDVQLSADVVGLDEVVVIGYGVQKKEDKTGAVSQVTAEEMVGGTLTDPIQGLQGKAAGVLITKKGGDPNAGFSVKIRGASGFDSNTQPLYVIDGVAGADPSTVAPEDIESYDILKDAASTAIYGSRGANGVIFITTKKGTTGAGQVQFNSHIALSQVENRFDLLSANDIRNYVSENNLNFSDGGANVDWQDEVFRTGIAQNYNLSYSGGNENSTYYGSVTHADWEGIMHGTDKQRTVGKLNIIHKALNNKLTLSTTLQGTVEKNDYENYDGFDRDDIIYQMISHNPTDPVYTEDEDYYRIVRAFNYENPLAVINMIDNIRDAKRFLGNFKADLELVEGLVGSVNLGYIRNDHENSYFRPKDVYASADNGFGRKNYDNNQQVLMEVTGTYTKTFSDFHNFNALAGYSWQESNWNGFYAQAENPQSDFISYNNLGSFIDITSNSIGSWAGMSRLIGFFGRVQYNYDSKYFFAASVRRDGSSKFGIDNKWGTFPTVSLGWDIHDESFLANANVIDQLKLRASYGVSGNQEIGEYRSQIVFEPTGSATDPESGSQVTTFGPAWNANPDLRWESTYEVNLGIDFGFFRNRLSGTIEAYNKDTKDLLGEYAVPVPPNLARRTFVNTGSLNNRGIELFVQGFIVSNANFKWKASFTGAHNKTTINELGDFVEGEVRREGYLTGRGLIGDNNWITGNIENEELGAFYLPVYEGLSSDGVFLYKSQTGGITRELADVERELVGSPLPDLELGLSQNFTFFQHWTLDIALRSLIGNDVYNATRMFFDYPGLLPSLNAMPDALEWKEEGRTSGPAIADIYVEDGSFLKVDYISLGYNVPMNNVDFAKRLRLYVSANNLYTFTNYSGADPETTFSGLSFGVDQYNVYPKARTLTFGISATF
ncbi:MAG: SusC/RagA family TonB-linked outer membrane protein [Bacteroidota bacterium]